MLGTKNRGVKTATAAFRSSWGGILAAALVATSPRVLACGSGGMGDRVHITPVVTESSLRYQDVHDTLEARFAPTAGKANADQRLISLRFIEGDADHFNATIFDYASEKGYELVLDAAGTEIGRRAVDDQPPMALDELRAAAAIVESSPSFSDAIASGAISLYKAMPPITVGADGRRLI